MFAITAGAEDCQAPALCLADDPTDGRIAKAAAGS